MYVDNGFNSTSTVKPRLYSVCLNGDLTVTRASSTNKLLQPESRFIFSTLSFILVTYLGIFLRGHILCLHSHKYAYIRYTERVKKNSFQTVCTGVSVSQPPNTLKIIR